MGRGVLHISTSRNLGVINTLSSLVYMLLTLVIGGLCYILRYDVKRAFW